MKKLMTANEASIASKEAHNQEYELLYTVVVDAINVAANKSTYQASVDIRTYSLDVVNNLIIKLKEVGYTVKIVNNNFDSNLIIRW